MAAAKQLAPYLVCAVLIVLIGVASFKGLKPLWSRLDIDPFHTNVLVLVGVVAVIAGLIGIWVTRQLVKGIQPAAGAENHELVTPDVSRALTKATLHLRRVRDMSEGTVSEQARQVLEDLEKLHGTVHERVRFGTDSAELQKVERIFVFLQILTACFVAFSHGSNDVANAIGPLSAAFQAIREGEVALKAAVPGWALALGGVGIIAGLATWGWRVIRTVGERITELTPSRGFSAEFAAALVILMASIFPIGLPISTTHTLVGAVLGVGLARGLGALNLSILRDILASWIITIPAGAGLAILFFYTLKFLLLDPFTG